MESVTPKSPFYESRWFKGTAAVVGLLTAVFAFGGIPKPNQLLHDLTAEAKLPLTNTEIVLDKSSEMRKPFGGGTKLDAAAGAVARFAADTVDSGLALRATGGGCFGEGVVMVGPGAGHGDEVREAVAGVEPRGRSNVIGTVLRAIDEFSQERFHRTGSTQRIVVFTGGQDECAEAAGQEVRDQLEGSGVKTTFRMYALGLSKRERAYMIRFRAALAGKAKVEYWPVENRRELDKAVGKEAEEIDQGKVPAPPPETIQAEVEAEASSILGEEAGEVEEAEAEEEEGSGAEEEETETEETDETEEEAGSTGEEETEEVEETEEAATTESTTTEAGPVERSSLYASRRTGKVFSWLTKVDSVNFGLPAMLMFG